MNDSRVTSWVFLLFGAVTGWACHSLPDAFPDRLESQRLTAEGRGELQRTLTELFGLPREPRVLPEIGLDPSRVIAGQRLFGSHCARCHGVLGDGDGLWLDARRGPRDFRSGIFKYSSTGATPTRADLERTIRQGLPGTRMTASTDTSPAENEAMIEYMIFIAIRGSLERRLIAGLEDGGELADEAVQESLADVVAAWASARGRVIRPEAENPPVTGASIARGRDLFLSKAAQCYDCHGIEADGEGRRADSLQDDWGNAVAPPDLREVPIAVGAARSTSTGGSPVAYRGHRCRP